MSFQLLQMLCRVAQARKFHAGQFFTRSTIGRTLRRAGGGADVSRRFAPDSTRLAEFAKTLSEASSPVLI